VLTDFQNIMPGKEIKDVPKLNIVLLLYPCLTLTSFRYT